MTLRLPLPLAIGSLLLGCGGGSSSDRPPKSPLERALQDAASPTSRDFPATGGRTLQAIANGIKAGPQVGLATSVLVPGAQRVAFGVIGSDKRFVYGKSALYVAESPGSRARGPYPAPADSIVPEPPFLSRGAAADTKDIKAIYAARVPFPKPGRYSVLAVSKQGARLVGAATQVRVKRSSAVPDVGGRPPRIRTDTVGSAGGELSKIDTRVPHDDMHKVDVRDVLGKRPVALLFSTPQLCRHASAGR